MSQRPRQPHRRRLTAGRQKSVRGGRSRRSSWRVDDAEMDVTVDRTEAQEEALNGVEGGDPGRWTDAPRVGNRVRDAAPADGAAARRDHVPVPVDLRTEGEGDHEAVIGA